ncbi:hypothetical protein GQ44DRAFT_624875 [Phaeosphaeriaceae sp. PMI808]|nr:hypothetical protein GQ44DRAFT_624875 [Phaeosphaeriaceae sp. PMI808]
MEPSGSETTATWTNNQNIIDNRRLLPPATTSGVDCTDQESFSEADVNTIASNTSNSESNADDKSSATSIQSELSRVSSDNLRLKESNKSTPNSDTTENHNTQAAESPSRDSGKESKVLYSCKGCGEILKEGEAWQLAEYRWHLDCFRCTTCGTLLENGDNLLQPTNGSLICNNCTYPCKSCGERIEDLAILAGDDAFCVECFKCRNCKRKIENYRYARTSQGLFCMDCHESLMARRRKKTREQIDSRAEQSPPSLPDSIPMTSPQSLQSNPDSEPPRPKPDDTTA